MRYPGGKGKLSNEILGCIKNYYRKNNCFDTCEYVEPFLGAGSIGLSLIEQCPIKNICINDRDKGMSSLWTAIIYYPDQLCEMVDSFQPSVNTFFEYKDSLRDYKILHDASVGMTMTVQDYINCTEYFTKEDSIRNVVKTALMKLAIHQMSYSGLGTVAGGPIGGKSQSSNYKIDCRWNAKSIKNKIKKIHKLLSNINIRYKSCSHYDWASIILDCYRLYDNGNYECFVYLDPPYYKKGPELYQFHFNEYDHLSLSNCLKDFKHPWLLSYDNVDEIKQLYSWAKIKELSINYTINTSRNNKELLIVHPDYDFLLQDDIEIGF